MGIICADGRTGGRAGVVSACVCVCARVYALARIITPWYSATLLALGPGVRACVGICASVCAYVCVPARAKVCTREFV